MLWGQHLQTGDIVGLETFCMLWGASQPLWKTFVRRSAHPGDDTMVRAPREASQPIFAEKKTSYYLAKMTLRGVWDQSSEDNIS